MIFDNILIYSHRNDDCQKILPAHFLITKRDFILRGSWFFEKYSLKVHIFTLFFSAFKYVHVSFS